MSKRLWTLLCVVTVVALLGAVAIGPVAAAPPNSQGTFQMAATTEVVNPQAIVSDNDYAASSPPAADNVAAPISGDYTKSATAQAKSAVQDIQAPKAEQSAAQAQTINDTAITAATTSHLFTTTALKTAPGTSGQTDGVTYTAISGGIGTARDATGTMAAAAANLMAGKIKGEVQYVVDITVAPIAAGVAHGEQCNVEDIAVGQPDLGGGGNMTAKQMAARATTAIPQIC